MPFARCLWSPLAARYRHNPRCPAGYTYSAKHSDGDEAVAAFMKEAKAAFALGFRRGLG